MGAIGGAHLDQPDTGPPDPEDTGLPDTFELIDTAGLRDNPDTIEREGIRRARAFYVFF